jgi:hypothetical protein
MTSPSITNTQHAAKTMAKEKNLRTQIYEEIAKFEKTREELHLLKNLSQDLKNYRKMIKLKKYD